MQHIEKDDQLFVKNID